MKEYMKLALLTIICSSLMGCGCHGQKGYGDHTCGHFTCTDCGKEVKL